jgi:hypothetical protein
MITDKRADGAVLIGAPQAFKTSIIKCCRTNENYTKVSLNCI